MYRDTVDIRTYRLDSDAFRREIQPRIMRQNILRGTLLLMVVLGVQVFMALKQTGDLLVSALPGVLLVAVILAYVLRNRLKREHERWVSYQLTMGPNVLRRHIDGLPAIEVLRDEVSAIVSSSDGGLNVVSADPRRFVYIPLPLVGFSEVRARLTEWKTIEPHQPSPGKVKQNAIAIALLAVWGIACGTSNFWIALGGEMVLIGYVIWAERELARSLTMDTQTKRRTKWMFRLFALGPIARWALPVLSSFVSPQP